MRRTTPLVILGAGYTGHQVYALAKMQGRRVHASSRHSKQHLAYAEPADRIEFDLARCETWQNIPNNASLIWCFPAAPPDQVQTFARTIAAPPKRLVVLGSTLAYDVPNQSDEYPPPWLDESAPIDLSKPRVQGEEYLRRNHEAVILRVAGIYGPGRNPLDWIRQGRVGPSRRYVNLIHVKDLAEICLLALERGKPGEIYNVSDGRPRMWKEICEIAHERWGTTIQHKEKNNQAGKRVATTKLRQKLGCRIQHPDLYAAIEEIEPQ